MNKAAAKKTAPAPVSNAPEELIELARGIREQVAQVKGLTAELELAKKSLIEQAVELRNARLAGGNGDATLRFPLGDGNVVKVTYPETYKGVDPRTDGEVLEDFFGSDYSLHVAEKTTLKLRKDMDVATLKAQAGKAWSQIAMCFEIEETLVPRDGAFERIAELYRKGETEKAEGLLDFVATCTDNAGRVNT